MGNQGTKRKFENDEEDQTQNSSESDLHTPKRKRTKSTSKYIYQTLFLDGENSDVTIKALGNDWNLHKHYLCQCGYFNSMFNGNWLESEQAEIEVDILDSNIDQASLKIAFGSLYKDDIFLKPVQVTGVLAAATFLQLEGLIQHCSSMMKEFISSDIVVQYYHAANKYGLMDVKQYIFDWLLHNLMSPPNFRVLKHINLSLMKELISSPDLWVLQVEMDIYSLLRKWIFLRKNSTWNGNCKELLVDLDLFFKNSHKQSKVCYLETLEGREYIDVFQQIRWQHVINESSAIKAIKCEYVLPEDWLNPLYKHQWFYRLQSEQNLDKGPKTLEEDYFNKECTRNGRMLIRPGEYCWRWIGYNYGVDLLVSYINGMILVKRNCSNNSSGSIGLQDARNVMLRLSAVSLDNKGCVVTNVSTGLRCLYLTRDEECVLLRVKAETVFPLYVILNILVYTPLPDYPCPALNINRPLLRDFSDVAVQTIGQNKQITECEVDNKNNQNEDTEDESTDNEHDQINSKTDSSS